MKNIADNNINYILNIWLKEKKEDGNLKIQSYQRYESLINTYIRESLGNIKCASLIREDIINFFKSPKIYYLSTSVKKSILSIIKSVIYKAYILGKCVYIDLKKIKFKNRKREIIVFTKKEHHKLRHRRKLRGRQLKRHRRVMIISIFVIILTLSVGYAAFQTVISINIKGNIVRDETCVNGHVWEFSQKDEGQEFKVPCSGEYKVELWGAGGGGAYYSFGANTNPGYEKIGDYINGGKGAYTSGVIILKKSLKFELYIGSI